jgi:hypothetical protein
MQEPPQNEPPQQYAQYYRGGNNQFQGSSQQLQALSDGYFGLNNVFIVNVVLVFAARIAQTATQNTANFLIAVLASILVLGLAVGFLSYPVNKKVGYGAGWQPSGPVFASILMGINSALCCGVIGYFWVQSIAAKKMKEFGVQPKGFGLKKKDIQLAIQELQRQEAARQAPAAPPPPVV